MNPHIAHILYIVLALSVMLTLQVRSERYDSRVAESTEQDSIMALQDSIAAIQEELRIVRTTFDKTRKQREKHANEYDALTRRIDSLHQAIAQKEQFLGQLDKQLAELKGKGVKQQADILPLQKIDEQLKYKRWLDDVHNALHNGCTSSSAQNLLSSSPQVTLDASQLHEVQLRKDSLNDYINALSDLKSFIVEFNYIAKILYGDDDGMLGKSNFNSVKDRATQETLPDDKLNRINRIPFLKRKYEEFLNQRPQNRNTQAENDINRLIGNGH